LTAARALGSHVLDNPAWTALSGPQSHLAEVRAKAARFQAEITPFTGLADPDDPLSWQDLAALVGPGTTTAVIGPAAVPAGWTVLGTLPGVQMLGDALEVAPDPDAVRLTESDVPAMLDLVERTKPGPFQRRTIEMGNYLGIKENGQLIAMAGERLKPPGWTEISAVCTDPAHRGKRLAARLIRAVGHEVRQRGEVPFLHAAASNTNAIRLYAQLGFSLRRRPDFIFLRTPDV
jgi:ribosomal protein S18 acetylase RimI-like enzyme